MVYKKGTRTKKRSPAQIAATKKLIALNKKRAKARKKVLGKKIVKRKVAKKAVVKRKKNPSPRTNRKVNGAIDLYQRFREEDPEFVDEIEINHPKVGMVIGTCDGVLYTTTRGGKTEAYKHEFSGKSRPLLCSSWDGKQIFVVGGRYNFTEDGITDY